MTDSNDSSFLDSSLFGNNNDLYESKRHYDEFEPFAQPLPPSAEPLFPTAAPASDSPADYLARYNTHYQDESLDEYKQDEYKQGEYKQDEYKNNSLSSYSVVRTEGQSTYAAPDYFSPAQPGRPANG